MKWFKWFVIILIIILCTGAGIWFLRPTSSKVASESKDTKAAPESDEPVAQVQVTPLKESVIEESATLYGSIIAASQQVKTYSVPFECRVKQIKVTLGQTVQKEDLLLEIEPSLSEILELKQARNELQSAQAMLKKMNEKMELKLTTRQEVMTAQQSVDQAKLKLDNLMQEGLETRHQIISGENGIINQLDIQNSQIIPGNTVLVSVLNNNSMEGHLGISSDNLKTIKVGQTIWLSPVNRPASSEVKGTIRLITNKVNPETRLVDILVTLPTKHSFLLSDYIQGRVVTRSAKGFVVPRNAVLPDEKGFVMYTLDKGKAVQHHVQVGLENGQDVQVIEKGLTNGIPVVTQGNYELKDGMDVETTAMDTK